MILVRFLRSSAREKVLRAVKEKGALGWDGYTLSFPDMSKELAQKRKNVHQCEEAAAGMKYQIHTGIPGDLEVQLERTNQEL